MKVTTISHDGITDTWRGWAERLGVTIHLLKARARLMRRAGGGVDPAKLLAPHKWPAEWRATKEHRGRSPEKARQRRERMLAWLAELKAAPCVDCGGSFLPCAMDFDHRDPAEKSFQISNAEGKSKERILAEIAKCDLVCANCHRVRTWRARETPFRRSPIRTEVLRAPLELQEPSTPEARLNPRQRAFAEQWSGFGTGVASARAAGYTGNPKVLQATSGYLLKQPHVRARIIERLGPRAFDRAPRAT